MDNVNVMYQLSEQSSCQMMSYVIHTKDDKIILVDGGTEQNTAYLLNMFHTLKGDKIVIDGWFLTHAHLDHINAFMDIIGNHGDEVEIKKVYYNFPDAEFIRKYEEQYFYTIEEFNKLLPLFKEKSVILKEGDVIDFGEAVFKILYTPDPTFTHNAINNSSVVIKMYIDGQSVLFLGDLGVEAGNKILDKYGSIGLKSDMVQMSHHGQNGVEKKVYEAISPKACLWSTPLWLWNNDAGNGYNTGPWQTVTVRGWMEELKVQYHHITKDGTCKICFPAEF